MPEPTSTSLEGLEGATPDPSALPSPADLADAAGLAGGRAPGATVAPSLIPPPEPPFGAAPEEWSRAASPLIVPPAPKTSRIPPAPSSRTLPPMPAIEPILEHAAEARAKGDWDTALEAYKKALFLVDANDVGSQASLYAYVAEVKLAQGKTREAETNFEKALNASPKHVRSIDALVAIAVEGEEWARVVTYRKKRADALEDEDDRAEELCRVADVYERHLSSPEKAIAMLEAARAIRPDDMGVLLKLRHFHEALRQWSKALDVLDELYRVVGSATERAAHRFAQADIVLGRLRDEPRGLAFLELALDEDPQHDRALAALLSIRTRREEWAELAAIYERLIDRLAGLGDRARAWEICKKVGVLRRDKLHDGPGAVEALRGAVELYPDDAESRAALAELYAAKGERTLAVRELEIVATYAPLRAQTYRRLYDLHARAQRPDRAWLVATCLEELSAADVSHEMVVEQFRPEGPIRPTTALDEAWWDDLRAVGADPIVSDVLRIVAPSAVAIRLEELAAKKKLPALDPSAKQDAKSTASVVRTFVWAARALGIAAPDLFLLEDVPSGIAAVPAPHPATALGPQVRSGMSVQQLAFLAGRHLTYYRPDHYALVFYPTLAELSSLVLAAMRLVIPEISVPPPPDGELRAVTELGARLSAEDKERLEAAVHRLDDRGGKLDLFAWIRHVELTAARAGLLLAGDLRTVLRIVKTEEARKVGDLAIDAKRGDLLAFAASDAYGKLRERMGIAILPPSPGSGPTL